MDSPCNGAQALRTVVDGVHGRHHSQKYLRGTNVARRLVAADVLLPGLKRQPISRMALRIFGKTYQPARKGTLKRFPCSNISSVRSAKTHRHPKALGRAYGNVSTPFAGRRDQREGQRIGRHNTERANGMRFIGECREIANSPESVWHLNEHGKNALIQRALEGVSNEDAKSERLGPG